MGSKWSVPSSPSSTPSSAIAATPPQLPQRWAWSSSSNRSNNYIQDAFADGSLDMNPISGRQIPRRAVATPSTATPTSDSRSSASDSRSSFASSFASSAAESRSSSSLCYSKSPELNDSRLLEARRRVSNSMEALQMELRGFGGVASMRFVSWPAGTKLEVLPAQGSSQRPFIGKMVRFDAQTNMFEIALREGGTIWHPPQRVRRVQIRSALDEASAASRLRASASQNDQPPGHVLDALARVQEPRASESFCPDPSSTIPRSTQATGARTYHERAPSGSSEVADRRRQESVPTSPQPHVAHRTFETGPVAPSSARSRTRQGTARLPSTQISTGFVGSRPWADLS